MDWIKNTHGEMPVSEDTLVDIIWDDNFDEPECGIRAGQWAWFLTGAADITHWRLHQELDEDGYTQWSGGECPVSEDTAVDYKVRNGGVCQHLAGDLRWDHWQWAGDIVAYKVADKEQTVEVPEVEPTPDTNPKRALGIQSIPLHLWSDLASAYGALALYDGAGRYGTNNYKATKVEASIYLSAMRRHIASWSEGEECDPVTGVPHLGAVLANVAILLEARAAGTLIDDRNIGTGWLQERDSLKEIVKQVAKANEGREPKHYTRKEG